MLLVTILGGMIAVVGAVVVVSQATGISRGRPLIVAQTLTPHLAVLCLVVAVVTAIAAPLVVTVAVAVVAVALVVTVLAILRTFPRVAPPAEPADSLRVFLGNLLDDNGRPAVTAAAIAELTVGCDVAAFVEYTPRHAAALHDAGVAARFAHRHDEPADNALGTAVWTSSPVDRVATTPMRAAGIAVRLADPIPVVVHATHPTSPIVSPAWWRDELALLTVTPDVPTVLVGDFNATIWHPPFRRLLASGWTDAHLAHGHRWSGTWNQLWRLPWLARLDHALVSDGLDIVAVDDNVLPGSDHRGVIVTVSPRR